MNTKITREQFEFSLKLQNHILHAQQALHYIQNHLDFLTRSGDLDGLVSLDSHLNVFADDILQDYIKTLSDHEK